MTAAIKSATAVSRASEGKGISMPPAAAKRLMIKPLKPMPSTALKRPIKLDSMNMTCRTRRDFSPIALRMPI